MNYKILAIMLLMLAIPSVFAASPPAVGTNLFTDYSAFTNWEPIIVIAAILTVMLAAVYYMIGYILNNQRIKGAAIVELQQAFGSILLVIIILAVFSLVGTSTLGFSNILGTQGTSDVQSMCSTYLNFWGASTPVSSTSQIANPIQVPNTNNVDFLNSYDINAYDNLPEPTTAVCQSLILPNGAGVTPTTANLDYGLAATYVIIANMSYQVIGNLNALYNYDSVLFFLRNLNPFIIICAPVTCANPLETRSGIKFSYSPYVGYVLQRAIMPAMATESNLSTYFFTFQMMLILLLLVGWPYLLAGGIVLRTIPFTRRIGGLLTAIAIIGLIIFPTLFLFEYSTLNNLGTGGSTLIGLSSSQIPALALCGYGPVPGGGTGSTIYCYTNSTSLQTSYVYKNLNVDFPQKVMQACQPTATQTAAQVATAQWGESNPFTITTAPCYIERTLSFYSFPRFQDIIAFYGCYPNSILGFEGEFLGATLLNTAALPITTILSIFGGAGGINLQNGESGLEVASPALGLLSVTGIYNPLANSCLTKVTPYNVAASLEALADGYGELAVSGFILPILNILVLLSAIVGLSSLMGGETVIVGLSRFI